jgi:CBS domain containing-hemolysin-like protein
VAIMNEWAMVGIGLVLTVGTGIFVAAEFALVNLDRHDL